MSDILRIAGIVLLVISQASCQQQSKRVQLNLEEGFQFKAKLTVARGYLTKLVGVDKWFKDEREVTTEFLCRVIEERSDGNMRIEFNYKRIRDCFAGRQYDSADPNTTRHQWARTYIEEAFDALVGRSFIAQVGPDGVVREVEGLDELWRDLHNALAFRPTRKMEDSFRKQMEDLYERDFQKFVGDYWPLSQDRLKETIQQLFLVWPQVAIDTGASWYTRDTLPALALRRANFWTLKSTQANTAVVELISDVHTDSSLCDPNIPEIDSWDSIDFLGSICQWCRRKVNPVSIYAGERKGSFNVDLKSGLLRDAMWTEELSGIVPGGEKGETERIAIPSKRTQSVSVQITLQGNNGTSKASESHP